MTFDGPINSTWGEAIAQMRDKITGMANHSLVEESSSGTNSFAQGDWFVISLPNGEYMRIAATNYGDMEITYGPSWDTGSSSWTDQYSQSFKVMPRTPRDNYHENMNMGDQVRWWLEYVDTKGFVLAATREEGDGNDAGCVIGAAELTRLWDYTTAQVREGKYAFLAVGTYSRDNYEGNVNDVNHTAEGGGSGGTYDGKGQVNADGNNDNFPMVETSLVASSKYENALIGEHDLWIVDNSGNRSAHLDTVTEGGIDKYQIFKEGITDNTPIGIRMD